MPRYLTFLLTLLFGLLYTTAAFSQTTSTPPIIGYLTKYASSVHADCSVIIYGENFTSDTKIYAWRQTEPAKVIPPSWKQLGSSAMPTLPALPPTGSKSLKILHQTSQVIIALSTGMNVLWAQNSAGTSPPVVFARPEIWTTSENEVLPGQCLRLFGINFHANTGYIILRNAQTGALTQVQTMSFVDQNDWVGVGECEMDCLIPADCRAGDYFLYVHAGVGGDFGFSDPYALRITEGRTVVGTLRRPDDPSPIHKAIVTPVTRLNGDGLTDNSSVIQTAINKLASHGGGILRLPTGKFAIAKTLHLKPGIVLQGVGQDATKIVVTPFHPLQGGFPPVTMTPSLDWQTGYAGDWQKFLLELTPMIWIETNAGVQDLTLIGGPGTGACVFVATRDWHDIAKDVFLAHVDIENPERMKSTGTWRPYPNAILVGAATEGFTLWHCNIRAGAPLSMLPARPEHRWAHIIGNHFEDYPHQSSLCVSINSLSDSVIEENETVGGRRAWHFQRGFHNNWFFNNTISGVGRRGNADEMMMSEYGSNIWVGKAGGASAKTITAMDAPKWKSNQMVECSDPLYVFILAGRGLGQFRHVVANTGATLTLDLPWTIIPDDTSRFALTGLTLQNLYINNTVHDCDGRVELAYGSLVECVVMGHQAYHNEGLSTTSWIKRDKNGIINDHTIVAHNLYAQNRILEDGWITLLGSKASDFPSPGSTFGNIIRDNEIFKFRNYAMNQYWAIWDRPSSTDAPLSETWAGIGVSGSFNVIEGNYVCDGAVGINIRPFSSGNVVRNNRIDKVSAYVRDQGADTVVIPPVYQKYEAVRQ